MYTRHQIIRSLMTLAMTGLASGCFLFGVRPTYDWYALGHSAYQANRLEEAHDDFVKVAPTDSNYQKAQFYLGAILARNNQLEPALEQLQRARDLGHATFDVDSEMVRALGSVYAYKTKHWTSKADAGIAGVWPTATVILTLDHRGTLSAINPDTQSVVWEKAIGTRGNSVVPVPQFDDTRVFISGSEKGGILARLWAIDLKTGRDLWSADLGHKDDFAGVAIDHDYVYAGFSRNAHQPSTLNAYRKSDGKLAFASNVDSQPGPVVANSDMVCTQTVKNTVYCGKRSKQLRDAWTYQATDKLNGFTIDHGHLYATIRSDLYAFNVGATTPLAWKIALGTTVSTPAVADGNVYVQTVPSLRAFDAATGKEVWTMLNPGKLISFGGGLQGRAPVALHGLVIGWTDELVFAVPTEGKDFAWMVFPMQGRSSNPGFGNGDLVVAGSKGIAALTPKSWTTAATTTAAAATTKN
jgi:hypothetical protein